MCRLRQRGYRCCDTSERRCLYWFRSSPMGCFLPFWTTFPSLMKCHYTSLLAIMVRNYCFLTLASSCITAAIRTVLSTCPSCFRVAQISKSKRIPYATNSSPTFAFPGYQIWMHHPILSHTTGAMSTIHLAMARQNISF